MTEERKEFVIGQLVDLGVATAKAQPGDNFIDDIAINKTRDAMMAQLPLLVSTFGQWLATCKEQGDNIGDW